MQKEGKQNKTKQKNKKRRGGDPGSTVSPAIGYTYLAFNLGVSWTSAFTNESKFTFLAYLTTLPQ